MDDILAEILDQSIEIIIHRKDQYVTIIAHTSSGSFECYAESTKSVHKALTELLERIKEKAEYLRRS